MSNNAMDVVSRTATSVDSETISVTKVVSQITTQEYSHAGLVAQRQAIQEQQARDNAQREAELAEVDDLLAAFEPVVIEGEKA